MTTICPCCKQPPRLDRQGFNPARVNGEIVFTEYRNLATCLTPDCEMQWVTLDESVYQRMSESEAQEYLEGKSK